MPKAYKVIDEDSKGNTILWGSDASIVSFDSTNAKNLDAKNAQAAIEALNLKAESKANVQTLTATISASAFEGTSAPYTQKVEVDGILATDTPDVGAVLDDDLDTAIRQREAFGGISNIRTGDGYLTVFCYEDKPLVDIPIQIRIIR
jgi:hypothetical protein